MKPMLALGEGVLGVIAAFAIGTLVLTFLLPIIAGIKKTRLIALCGSALLIGLGLIGFQVLFALGAD